MDHLYIISDVTKSQLNLSIGQSFFDAYSGKITIINFVNNKKTESKITNDIHKHINAINHISIDKFNWIYYYKKYNHLLGQGNKIKSEKSSWDQWTNFGKHENHNPIDRKTIFNNNDVNFLLSIMMALSHATKNNYEKIFIINASNQLVKFADFNLVINDYPDIVKDKNMCIFSYMQINYAYIIHKSIFNLIFCECSYFINKFDDIVKIYIHSDNEKYQIFNHSNNNVYTDHNVQVVIPDKDTGNLPIDTNHLLRSIGRIKPQYFKNEYNRFISTETPTPTSTQIECVNYIMCKLPYDKLKIIYNSSSNLSFYNYLKLCANLTNYDFWKFINFQPYESGIPDFSTIYFDPEFYFNLYPSYKNSLKNDNDAYNHYINHGRLEKLIGNNILFELIKLSQDYHLQKYLNKFNNTTKYDTMTPIFYNHTYTCIDDTIAKTKPVIYILTRTSNREQLFKQCCESINKQLFVNIRHIVSYDNEVTKNYVKSYDHIYKTVDLISKKSKIHPNQYIDCIYESLETCEPGWVLVLDDDDKLMTNHAIYNLEKYMTDPLNLITWMLYRPDKFIYPVDKNNPIVGEIGSCCYLYHTTRIKKGIWASGAIGDFPFFKFLFDTSKTENHIYVDYPLTGINYDTKISGWTAM